ncbi:MAG: DUF4878 domain-containing protein [Bacteroidales bacterium]|jgi:hypothetical protein|nr:DUF4878 domain-containing protein [Bacteroidales bacterium]MDD4213480.1 DUF4878 domain-containing protein [Bacteroidales bacterium]
MKTKSVVSFFLLVIFSLLIFSCKTRQKNENQAAETAVKFLKHLAKFEFDQARMYGTETTSKTIDMISMMYEMSKKNGKEADFQPKDINVEVIKTAIDGKNAIVNYKNENGEIKQVELVKVNGKWLVNMKKETPIKGNK